MANSAMEKHIGIMIFFLLFGFCCGQNELNPEGIYCLSYTWLGPDFNVPTDEDGDVVDMTCADYLIIGNNTNTPCKDPIIFSSDTITMPDVAELWETDKSAVACRKSDSQSCVKYTVSFNGLITYQTHLCTRVRTKSDVIRTGCLSEKRNNMDIKVCVCESQTGLELPCNSATTYAAIGALTLAGLFVNWISYVLM